ncbi:DIP1984 family protein [Solibacillus sp. FSL K6-4121]|uniref:DIP1984 family protein n=1 Tax=Solibacillus sp. FSL K6-4121 TaxID=2921505 RepID=UPI0030F75865
MSINLAEAVKLKSVITKKIQERTFAVNQLTHVIIEKGEQPKRPDYTLEMLEAELKQLRYDSRKLDSLIYRANIDNVIVFKDEEMPIVEAIELASQLRAEAALCKSLGSEEKEAFYHNSGEAILYRVALYDPMTYRTRANELEKEAHRLSNLINAKNYQVEIEFDDSNYF